MFAQQAAEAIFPFVEQAKILTNKYDCVVANPPYMGEKYFSVQLKDFAKSYFKRSKADLFSMFIDRLLYLLELNGLLAIVSMQNWMFLPSFEALRSGILKENTILSLVHIGFNSFPELNSKVALASAFVILKENLIEYIGTYFDLNSAPKSSDKKCLFENERSSLILFYSAKRVQSNSIGTNCLLGKRKDKISVWKICFTWKVRKVPAKEWQLQITTDISGYGQKWHTHKSHFLSAAKKIA